MTVDFVLFSFVCAEIYVLEINSNKNLLKVAVSLLYVHMRVIFILT